MLGYGGPSRRPASGLDLRFGLSCGRGVWLGSFLLDLYLALEVSAILDRNTLGHNITEDDGGFPHLYSITGPNVALQLALNHHTLGVDIGMNLAVRSDHQVIALQLDNAVNCAIDVQVLASGKFSLDYDRLT